MKNTPEFASVSELENINVIKIGDTVRSFDMEFKPFSWIIGKVVRTEVIEGCERYVIEVQKYETCRDENGFHDHVVESEEVSDGRKLYPPVNGSNLMFGENSYTNFVEVA